MGTGSQTPPDSDLLVTQKTSKNHSYSSLVTCMILFFYPFILSQSQFLIKMKTASPLLLALTLASDVTAFTTFPAGATSSSTRLHATNEDTTNVPELSRRGFVQNLGIAGMTAAAFLASPVTAYAEELESQSTESVVIGVPQSSNLRSIKRAEKQLSKLEFYAVENEFENMKLGLRNAPFSEVRKNCFALIRDYAGQPEQQSKLTASYDNFIRAVEKLDNTAGLGMRGRKLDNGELLQSFQASSAALNDFIAVATQVAQESS